MPFFQEELPQTFALRQLYTLVWARVEGILDGVD